MPPRQQLSKVSFQPIDVHIFEATSLERWNSHTELHGALSADTGYAYSHVTDAISLAALWKHGGVYIDFDMLVLQPLYHFSNAIGIQSNTDDRSDINFAVAIFPSKHLFLSAAMHKFAEVYNPKCWTCVGPTLISDTVARWSKLNNTVFWLSSLPRSASCSRDRHTLHIYSHKVFYPVAFQNAHHFLKASPACASSLASLRNHSATFHIWTKVSNIDGAEKGSLLQALLEDLGVSLTLSRKVGFARIFSSLRARMTNDRGCAFLWN